MLDWTRSLATFRREADQRALSSRQLQRYIPAMRAVQAILAVLAAVAVAR